MLFPDTSILRECTPSRSTERSCHLNHLILQNTFCPHSLATETTWGIILRTYESSFSFVLSCHKHFTGNSARHLNSGYSIYFVIPVKDMAFYMYLYLVWYGLYMGHRTLNMFSKNRKSNWEGQLKPGIIFSLSMNCLSWAYGTKLKIDPQDPQPHWERSGKLDNRT